MTTPNLFQPSLLTALTALSLTALTLSTAQAATLTFDDLKTPNLSALPIGYGSFTWENFGFDSAPYGQ